MTRIFPEDIDADGDAEGASDADIDVDVEEDDDHDGWNDCELTDPCVSHARSFGGTGEDFGEDLVVDLDRNVYFVGSFEGTIDLGGGEWTAVDEDGFIASYDAHGSNRWSRQLSGEYDQGLWGVAVDEVGNVFVTGFSPLMSYSADGLLRWEGPGPLENGMGLCVTTDRSGNVYAGGGFQDEADLGGGTVAAVLGDLFVVKFRDDGRFLRSLVLESAGSEDVSAIAVDDEGALYIAGDYEGSEVDIGGAPCPDVGHSDIFIASYWSDDLSYRWSRCFAGPGDEFLRGAGLDDEGNLYVAGTFSETVDFDGEVLESEGYNDILVASFSPEGELRWVRGFGGVDIDDGRGLTVDGDRVLVTGGFRETVDFGGTVLTSEGDWDAFLLALTLDGEVTSAERFGGAGMDAGNAVATDECGNPWITGFFSDSADFGGDTLTSAGSYDIFLLRLCE